MSCILTLNFAPSCADLREQVPAANASASAPPGTQDRLFNIWTYQTQLWQARAYEIAMSQWRRLKADASASTMGILCAPLTAACVGLRGMLTAPSIR